MSLPGQPTTYTYDNPDIGVLQKFGNPMPSKPGYRSQVSISVPEFTSLCPLTGQPDFATIELVYEPLRWCLESKSLKLYLGQYRMHREFHEQCVARIAGDLVALLDPSYLQVVGKFTPRGGIPFWPTVSYHRPAHLA